ncbi:unnamed protein product [Victoria cruziana]
MASELIFRGHDEASRVVDGYSPKLEKRWPPILIRPFHYFLREQRPLFVLLGIALASFFFLLGGRNNVSAGLRRHHHRQNYYHHDGGVHPVVANDRHRLGYDAAALRRDLSVASIGGKIPLGLKAKGKRIVVTGGAGFVGSHLVDRLIERGDSVIVVDNFFTGRKENVMHHMGNPRFELIRHDVVEPILLEVDQIYHLACPASPVHYKFNPVKTIKTNVVGTLNMLGLAKRVGARFLLTSTSEVYGDPLQHPQQESYWGNVNPIGVRSCYDEGKRTAETLTMDYHRGAGVEVRIARIFNTYGPRMCIDDGRVVSNFVAQVSCSAPIGQVPTPDPTATVWAVRSF